MTNSQNLVPSVFDDDIAFLKSGLFGRASGLDRFDDDSCLLGKIQRAKVVIFDVSDLHSQVPALSTPIDSDLAEGRSDRSEKEGDDEGRVQVFLHDLFRLLVL